MPAYDGRLICGIWSSAPLYPEKPPPPFGKLSVAATTMTAPDSISVISAKYRPRNRSAGSVISEPMIAVTRPASISTRMYGWLVANSSRAPTQAPIMSTASWPREYRPTRPTSSPRPSVTIE